ncbi:U3 small nucleolar RNA-associated protein MPP10, partial [Phenoliferia sp. Uapishka_3]
SDESDGGLEEGLETIERLKTSLFDEENSDEEGDSPAASLSRHERRLLALSSQIAQLEAENVGVKDWATKGEAKARDRPVNSLLEEDLEYERAGKVEPVITEETTKTIEDLIKKRILDNQFDDVIRHRAVDPNAFLPSRFMELQDTKSNKSLAEIYEEDYTTAKEKDAGRAVVNELDKDLEKKHAEIEELFEELSGKLDALSNARFTPKAPKATITTITNVAAITLESALPTTTSTSTLLAPEEVFVPDPTNEDRSDFTPSQKKQARQKRRKARASMAKSAEKFSAGAKGEKERATKELIGSKGVTVLGKGGKVEVGQKRKRPVGDDDGRSGVSLKL